MLRNLIVLSAILLSTSVSAYQNSYKTAPVAGPAWICTLTADFRQVSNVGIHIIDVERTWQGPGFVSCATPQGYEQADVLVTIRESGIHVGFDAYNSMAMIMTDIGISNFHQLMDSFDLGVSASATPLFFKGKAAAALSAKGAGGLSLSGKLSGGPALGLGASVTFLGDMRISNLRPRPRYSK